MDKKRYPAYTLPDAYKRNLLKDDTILMVQDLGAGSKTGRSRERKVSDIARTSVKHKRYSRLLYRLCLRQGYKRILELGTSLGVTTMYLAGIPGAGVITLEGAEEVANYAKAAFSTHGFENVEMVEGDFDHTLEAAAYKMGGIDLAFVDGNHRKLPTLRYFEQLLSYMGNDSCIVFDDIHWSREMEEAWDLIRQDNRVRLSIDLFFVGIVFFRREFVEKQHFTIRY
jgi:predicted O-methyltransferase YrrM